MFLISVWLVSINWIYYSRRKAFSLTSSPPCHPNFCCFADCLLGSLLHTFTRSVFCLHPVYWRLKTFPFNSVLLVVKLCRFLTFFCFLVLTKFIPLEGSVGEGDRRELKTKAGFTILNQNSLSLILNAFFVFPMVAAKCLVHSKPLRNKYWLIFSRLKIITLYNMVTLLEHNTKTWNVKTLLFHG